VAVDPDFALGYAALASAYGNLRFVGLPSEEAYPKSKAAALRALELDDSLAEAHVALGAVKGSFEWDWLGAEEEFKRAIELNPDSVGAHRSYSLHLTHMGRFEEALAEAKKAQNLDPLTPLSSWLVGWVYYNWRRYDEAIEEWKNTLELDPNDVRAHAWLPAALAYRGMHEEAMKKAKENVARNKGDPERALIVAWVHAVAGREEEARKILGKAKPEVTNPGFLAEIHALLGEKDEAFACLEKAYEQHHIRLGLIKVNPGLDPLRSDPRFQDLLLRMNFPE